MRILGLILRSVFFGCFTCWMIVSMMFTELQILTNSSFSEFMARDQVYEYLSVRFFYENIVQISIISFFIGMLIGFCWKPNTFKP
jgi:hypothetical protein